MHLSIENFSKTKVEFDEMTIDADVERTGDDVNKIEKVTLIFKVKGQNLNEKKLQKSLEIASKTAQWFNRLLDPLRSSKSRNRRSITTRSAPYFLKKGLIFKLTPLS